MRHLSHLFAQSRPKMRGVVLATVAVALLSVGTTTEATPQTPVSSTRANSPTASVPGPVGHQGRWLTDDQGRVVYFHGVNLVAKTPGQTPADMGFDDDDAAFLASNGFDVVRLGTTAASLMPTPGVIDDAYLDSFVKTVDTLTAHGLRVLVDLHQDGWGPTLGSNGFPGWMTLTHGAENTNTKFPLYYVTNPAIQAAFDSFWANEAGPGGIGLQDQVAKMFTALAGRLAGHGGLLGYDLLNEPWPGTAWQACSDDPKGCPAQDKNLDSYHEKMTDAIRAEDPDTMVFGEPYVLFNFGQAPTTIKTPGNDPASGLSYHVYTLDPANDPAVVQYADQWTARTGGALAITEFGATQDVATIERQVNLFDESLTPWMWWAYNENFASTGKPPSATTTNVGVIDALVRPHPTAIAGTPKQLSYDSTDRVLRFGYDSTRAGGGSFDPGTATEITVAPRSYPEGYQAKVTGGTITSEPGAQVLTVVADAANVFVKVWPIGQAEPSDQAPEPTEPSRPTTPPPAQPGPSTAPGRAPAVPARPLAGRASYTG